MPGALTHVGKEITLPDLENQVQLLVGALAPCSLALMRSFILFRPLYTFVAGDAASSRDCPALSYPHHTCAGPAVDRKPPVAGGPGPASQTLALPPHHAGPCVMIFTESSGLGKY